MIVPPIGGIPPLEPKASISKIFKEFFGENVVFFFLLKMVYEITLRYLKQIFQIKRVSYRVH